ncbi:MAG: rhodanese-like domain-containing protein [Nitrospirota bacterium]
MNRKLIAVLIAGMLFACAAPAVFAEEEIGEAASALRSNAPIPAGTFALIAKHADAYLSGTPHRTIFASVFNDGINVSDNPYDDLSDFFILDIRSAIDFGKGHIAGAVNVPFGLVAKPENLVIYPTDKPILVVCYTGHTASVATGILNTLGYDAWTLRFGMASWTASSSQKIFDPNKSQAIIGGGYPVE